MPSYALITLGQLATELSIRLYDPNMQFWSEAELEQRICDALRFWNILTAQNQQWYQLSVAESDGPWYDLQTLAGAPRFCSLQDTDVYSRLQYMLLESQLSDAGVLTSQFSTNSFVQAVQGKRDEFLFRTSTTRTIETLNVVPNVSLISLPQTVIQVERAYWLPDIQGTPYPLYRADQFEKAAFFPTLGSHHANPAVISTGIEPPLTLEMTPPPNVNGKVELVTIESQAQLSSTAATTLFLPSDFVPAIAWGAIADLLSSNAEAQDQKRADYARQRFEMYCEAVSAYPFLMGGRVLGIDTMCESVENLDVYAPNWRTPVVNQNIVAFAGQNLICYPTTSNLNLSLLINGNANLPANSAAFVQLGDEILDAVLDLAQHEAMFKQGFYEVSQSMGLLKNFLAVAAKRNDKIYALSTFKKVLYTDLNMGEKLNAPIEVSA